MPVNPPARRNVELKATDANPARSAAVCRKLGAIDHGVIVQLVTLLREALAITDDRLCAAGYATQLRL